MSFPPLDGEGAGGAVINPQQLRFWAYESLAPCPDTNSGGGIEAANNALTNVTTIRRDAVWVMIMLSDGAATATNSAPSTSSPSYGFAGFCPWNTFCNTNPTFPSAGSPWPYTYPECTLPPGTSPLPMTSGTPICNDNDPLTRHFCLQWSDDPSVNGLPQPGNPECGAYGSYDADDFARDWSDFAALQEVAPGVPGNFIAIFSIGFGQQVATSDVGAPLLRYMADAGDNGFLDDDYQQDLRDDGSINSSVQYGPPGPCQNTVNPT
jgi:hypothetical protein